MDSQDGRIRTGDLVPEARGIPGFPTSCWRGGRTFLSVVKQSGKNAGPPQKRPAGVEPALPPWQGGRLPLHHGAKSRDRIVKEL